MVEHLRVFRHGGFFLFLSTDTRVKAAEVETMTGAVVHAFTSGTMVQVFRLAGGIPADAWNGNESDRQLHTTEGLPC